MNKTLHALLSILSDGDFHSGEILGKKLGITRSAVWKNIHELSHQGIEIESIKRKGYRLIQPIEWLNQDLIKNELEENSKQSLDQILILNQIDSTNHYLMSIAKENLGKNIICYAEQQTEGKGRQGRPWVSPLGTNIYQSFLCHFEKDPGEIIGLSLVAAIAVVRALVRYGIPPDIRVKWPNDIIWKNKKLAGILLETWAENHGFCSVVIGIGLNTQMSATQSQSIDQPWTSLSSILNTTINRNRLAGLLLNELMLAIEIFKAKGFNAFIHEWRTLDNLLGKPIIIHHGKKIIHGIMKDINENGELILLNADNQEQRFLSGEVSLRTAIEC